MHKRFIALASSFGLSLLIMGAVLPMSTAFAQSSPSVQLAQTTPSTAHRSTRSSNAWYGFVDPLENATIPEVINKLTRFAMGIVGAVFLFYFMFGGVLWMTASGDPKQVQKAQRALVQSSVGITIVVLSYSIISFVIQLTNQIQTPPTN